ncbi:MAG: hypothetical protein R2847_06075 [Bacteroidia bacterium]
MKNLLLIPIQVPELKFAHIYRNYFGLSGSVGLSVQTTKIST